MRLKYLLYSVWKFVKMRYDKLGECSNKLCERVLKISQISVQRVLYTSCRSVQCIHWRNHFLKRGVSIIAFKHKTRFVGGTLKASLLSNIFSWVTKGETLRNRNHMLCPSTVCQRVSLYVKSFHAFKQWNLFLTSSDMVSTRVKPEFHAYLSWWWLLEWWCVVTVRTCEVGRVRNLGCNRRMGTTKRRAMRQPPRLLMTKASWNWSAVMAPSLKSRSTCLTHWP